MINFEEAVKIISRNTLRLPATPHALADSLGYVLAESIKAKGPVPRFDSSAVDGYAVRIEDIRNASRKNPKPLPVCGKVMAGDKVIPILKKGHAIKIFTGAPIPINTNAVLMQEDTEETNGGILFSGTAERNDNIRKHGEEFSKGDMLIRRGTLITPPIIGLLASLGYQKIAVYGKPRVGLVVTGNELQSPGVKLQTGMVYDSNSIALTAAMNSLGIDPVMVRRTNDNKRSIKSALGEAMKLSDVVISAGGVSVGEHDFVKEIFTELGVKKIFWKVAIKPGKPNYFGTYGRKLVFGLPGNPVAAMVSFHQLVMPALGKMMGVENMKSPLFKAKLSTGIKKKTARLEFVRGILSRNRNGEITVTPAEGQDSHMLGGLAIANCLIHFPQESDSVEKGSLVTVEFLRWKLEHPARFWRDKISR